MNFSSGTLLYRKINDSIEVLILHPSGSYNKHSSWSIPKGSLDAGESLEDAARRETTEEAGVTAGKLQSLGHVDYRSGKKRVYCFCGEVPIDTKPRIASWEVDKVEFVSLDSARKMLHPDQAEFISLLEKHLGSSK